ncbi:MAG TPA: DegV family protein [Solirubrobacteraceae bacterium]|nr:DegV family protein [Solirubrobacteraceae bacterium]
MRPVAIVSDSTHYLPPDLVREAGVSEVSLYVRDGGRQRRECDITDYAEFYAGLAEPGELPSTSQPSIGDFTAVYEPLIESGHDIVSIHLSAGVSGTHGAALQAKAMLEEQHPLGRIKVVDSQSAGGGLGCVVLAAAAVANAGRGSDEVVARASEAARAMRLWFCVDTLEYLQRGGRIGRAQAWLGGALQIKPILSIESEITPVERVRTAGRAFERMVDYMQALRDDGADAWVVQHIRAAERADALVARGRELFDSDPLWVSEVGPVIGTYTGPGLVGVGGLPSRLLA